MLLFKPSPLHKILTQEMDFASLKTGSGSNFAVQQDKKSPMNTSGVPVKAELGFGVGKAPAVCAIYSLHCLSEGLVLCYLTQINSYFSSDVMEGTKQEARTSTIRDAAVS